MLETFTIKQIMKVGDLVKYSGSYMTVDYSFMPSERIAMIVEGPNEVGNIRILLSNGNSTWVHCSDVSYFPKEKSRNYLKE